MLVQIGMFCQVGAGATERPTSDCSTEHSGGSDDLVSGNIGSPAGEFGRKVLPYAPQAQGGGHESPAKRLVLPTILQNQRNHRRQQRGVHPGLKLKVNLRIAGGFSAIRVRSCFLPAT